MKEINVFGNLFLGLSTHTKLFGPLLIMASLSNFALAEGTSTGNSTGDIVAHSGAKSYEKPSIVADVELNYNEVVINQKVVHSNQLEVQKFMDVNVDEFLEFYSFPNKKAELNELYRKASHLEGDFSDLYNSRNPFSFYIKEEHKYSYYKPIIDHIDYFPALRGEFISLRINEISNKTMESVFSLNQKTFDSLTEGITMNAKLQVNPNLKNNECDLCNTNSYKPIPKGGINLEVLCFVSQINKPEDNSFWTFGGSKSRQSKIVYTTNIHIKINSQNKTLSINTPLLTSEAKQNIINNFCQDPNLDWIKIGISCRLVGKDEKDTIKLRQSFGMGYIPFGTHTIKLVSENELKKHSAKTISLIGSLKEDDYKYVPSTKIEIPNTNLGVTFKDEYYDIFTYKFPKYIGFEGPTVYARSQADLADLVRRSFISSYEALNKKNEDQ